MNLLRVLFELFLLYMLYKIIFDFIIPVYTTTKKVKRQFGEMQQKMQDQQRQQSQGFQRDADTRSTTTKKETDYIDFEEVK